MKDILNSEIERMPKALLIEIINNIGLRELVYKNGDAQCPDGTIINDDELYLSMRDFIDSNGDAVLEDILTLDPCYIVDVTNIVYDGDKDEVADIPKELTFIMYDDDVSEENSDEYVNDHLDDKISDETGWCFLSCNVAIKTYIPYRRISRKPLPSGRG